MTDLSLNEVETLAAKAARGSGLSWGLADDVAKAARRLACAGLNWTDPVLRLAEDPHSAATGAALADLTSDEPQTLPDIGNPLLVAALAAAHPSARRVNWLDVTLHLQEGQVIVTTCTPTLAARHVVLTISPASQPHTPPPPFTRAEASPEALKQLESLAARTLVPASEQSRTAGAGAGLTDND